MTHSTDALAGILMEFSYWHAMHDVPFKPQAYELAAETVKTYGAEVVDTWKKHGLKGLDGLPGIGPAIAEKIDEYFRTGNIHEYQTWKKTFPVDIQGLSKIEGIGPKHIYQLWKELGVKDVSNLAHALKLKKVEKLRGFGVKSEERLARALALMQRASDRKSLTEILPLANKIITRLKRVQGVKQCVVAGSIRRRKADIGDIDLIATTSRPALVMKAFTTMPEVETVHEIGKTRSSVRLIYGIDADLRVVPDRVFGSTLQYFTGDRRHNILLRERAIRMGYKLNEYGLFKGARLISTKTEDDIYRLLGLQTPPPERRLGADEFIPLEPSSSSSGKSASASRHGKPRPASTLRRRSNRK